MSVNDNGITNNMLFGSITNDKLVNNYIHIVSGEGLIGGKNVELGETITLNVNSDKIWEILKDEISLETASPALPATSNSQIFHANACVRRRGAP